MFEDIEVEHEWYYESESNKFEYMQPTVEAICQSLINEPNQWTFDTFTFKKKGTKVEYWLSSCVTQVWTGGTTEQVFSAEQGNQIADAVDIARKKQASEYQKKIINSMKSEEKSQTNKWWEFWK